MILEIKYPCGTEIKLKTGFLDWLNGLMVDECLACPIHGTKCPSQITRRKKG